MKHLLRILFVIGLLAHAGSAIHAQQGLLRRGDRSYRSMSYVEAISLYEQAFAEGASSPVHQQRLADCYWTLRDFEKAATWYARVVESPEATAQDLYRHAELLRASGLFTESDAFMSRFRTLAPADSRGERKSNSAERLAALMDVRGLTHQVIKTSFNCERTDMSPFIHDDRIYFASARMPENLVQRHHTFNDQPFLNLYTGALAEDGEVRDIRPVREGLNTAAHESNAVVSKDGKELYFTRNAEPIKRGEVANLQILMCAHTGTGWGPEVPFTHNDPAYSYGHPALSRDGRRLLFTSDRPGGFGGKDIWVSERMPDGSWGEPYNLGPVVNTEGDEMFPYLHGSFLYFSSDGHLGFGGLDLFRVRYRNYEFGEVENLNIPINGPTDDFGICLDAAGELGFLTSDRGGPVGGEEIYLFRMNSRPEEERIWVGRVLDQRTAQPVRHLTMRLLDTDRKELARTTTTIDGIYEFDDPGVPALVSTTIPGGQSMEIPIEQIAVSKHGDTELPDIYLNSVMDLPVNAILRDAVTNEWLEGVSVTVKDLRDGAVLYHGITDQNGITQGQIPDRTFGDDLNLEVTFAKAGYFTRAVQVDFRVLMFLEQALAGGEGQALSPVVEGVDMSEAMNLRPIFFEYADATITTAAAGELDLVAQVMALDPSIRIELRSHTDSRASAEFNMELSQRRAEATKAYLVDAGIASFRITARGLGEREILNHCVDDVECTEEEHYQNRRTEFIVTGCEGCGKALRTVQR